MLRYGWLLLLPACGGGSDTGTSPSDRPDRPTDSGQHDNKDSGTAQETGDTGDAVETIPDAGDPSDTIFDGSFLPEFYIELSAESWQALRDDPYTYVEGSFEYDGTTWGHIAVRTKGENSWRSIDEKPSLKLKFDAYLDGNHFLGMDGLTLNAMNDDPSMMHERLAYQMYREAGIPAARANHAKVYLNDEYYGLYTVLDTVDKTMIERWYSDTTGPMYEVHDVDFYDSYIPYFTLELGEDDRTHLQGTADAFEGGAVDAQLNTLQTYMDLDQFLEYWAVGAVVAQYDAYPYSSPGDDCHVFRDAESDQLHWLPHGLDETFVYSSSDPRSVYGIVASTCLASTDCSAQWVERVWAMVDLMEEIDLSAMFQDVSEQIVTAISTDTRRDHSDHSVSYYQGLMGDMIRNRASQLENFLGPRPVDSMEVVSAGSLWYYRDSGVSPGPDWMSSDYSHGEWYNGYAPLGYGDDFQVTEIAGGDESDRHPTTWFRAKFDLKHTSVQSGQIGLTVDDGALVWVNGVEALRVNMPDGEITEDTYASSTASGETEYTMYTYSFDTDLLVAGENTVAVEVHQATADSSDLNFDLSMRLVLP